MTMPDMYRIVWLDSGLHKDFGWATKGEYLADAGLDQMTVTTVGMLMHEDDDIIVVALNYDPNHETWIGAQLIARSNVISVEPLMAHPEGA